MPALGPLLLAGLAVGAAGVVNGLTGFGFALVSVPLLVLVFPPAVVVTVALVLGAINSAVNALTSRRHVDVRLLRALLLAAVPGMVAGTLVLRLVDPVALKLSAAILVVAFTVVLALARRALPRPGPLATVAGGLSSGVLATSVGLSGPPVVLLTAAALDDRHVTRATLASYFALSSPLGLAFLAAAGGVPRHGWWVSLALAPVALLGRRLGSALLRHTPNHAYRAITLLVTLITGAVGIASAVGTLLART